MVSAGEVKKFDMVTSLAILLVLPCQGRGALQRISATTASAPTEAFLPPRPPFSTPPLLRATTRRALASPNLIGCCDTLACDAKFACHPGRAAAGNPLFFCSRLPVIIAGVSNSLPYNSRKSTALSALRTATLTHSPEKSTLPVGFKSTSRALATRILLPLLAHVTSVLGGLLAVISPSPLDVELITRLTVAAALGMIIGLERRTSHRPAGVRTMSLVAMGACTFTIVSQYGFARADQARVAASVASGVGFIGAGVITTSMRDDDNPTSFQSANDVEGEVKGLTTASAIWITSGLGMACGAGLFFTAIFGTLMSVAILKVSRLQTTMERRWNKIRPYLRPRKVKQEQEAAAAAKRLAAKAAGKNGEGDIQKNTGGDENGGDSEKDTDSETASREVLDREAKEIDLERKALRKEMRDAIKRGMDPDRFEELSAAAPEEKEKQRTAIRAEDYFVDGEDDDGRGYGSYVYEEVYNPYFGNDQVLGLQAGEPSKAPLSPTRPAQTPSPGGSVWIRSQVIPRRRRTSWRVRESSAFKTASDISGVAIPPAFVGDIVALPERCDQRQTKGGNTQQTQREQAAQEKQEKVVSRPPPSFRDGYQRPAPRDDDAEDITTRAGGNLHAVQKRTRTFSQDGKREKQESKSHERATYARSEGEHSEHVDEVDDKIGSWEANTLPGWNKGKVAGHPQQEGGAHEQGYARSEIEPNEREDDVCDKVGSKKVEAPPRSVMEGAAASSNQGMLPPPLPPATLEAPAESYSPPQLGPERPRYSEVEVGSSVSSSCSSSLKVHARLDAVAPRREKATGKMEEEVE